ncbi:mevalonate kinase [Methanothermococcus okinawensis]|uniref:Mevalonate kinase n=1 Tax=Methanothermococcus okinawensis (strain DSM 14208 / JCM 11175 / IH1) TaxID=647113 RepID=F8AKZ5_METOI|nr:mevalonate kinase [Methanothermococcus okinawensis]AEH06430.1 mevalonate kinase [Methanothermococcus okinawensis IH1]
MGVNNIKIEKNNKSSNKSNYKNENKYDNEYDNKNSNIDRYSNNINNIIGAPSKVILFGEHAVVDGYGAISMAVDLKTMGEIVSSENENNNKNKIIIDLKDLNKNIKLNIKDLPNINIKDYENDLKYVICSLKNVANYLIKKNLLNIHDFDDYDMNINNNKKIKPFKLIISSNIPVSCGLGSSASVIITTIKSFLHANNIKLSDDEIAKIAYSVEKEVQGKASITDTATITYNTILKIKNNTFELMKNSNLHNLLKKCNFLIVHVEERKKKTAELVNEVANHPYKNEIFKSIGEIVDKAESINSMQELGKLMVKNHELLKQLGVSTEKMDKVVNIGKKYGYGAKLSGAGGGGVVVILVNNNKKEELLEHLKEIGVIDIFECKMS